VNWIPRADALVKVVHPTMVAELLGISVEAVIARRAELNLPPVEKQFARRPFKGGGKRRISAEAIETLRTQSPSDAARMLGKSMAWVGRQRQMLGIAPERRSLRK
jgi:hypothetical protein